MNLEDSKLKYNNGVFSHSNFSFSFPENFYFKLYDDSGFQSNVLSFCSEDKKIHLEIEIGYCEETLDEYFEELFSNDERKKLSDFITVKRGNGKACGTYYVFKDNSTPTYEEVYYFKKNKYGENVVRVAVYLWNGNKKINKTIFEAVEIPEVKAFLNGFKYYWCYKDNFIMEQKNERNKNKKLAVSFAAINEETILPTDLLQEILPLLQEYFVGNFKIEGGAISIKFLNGQKFRLTVGELVK